MKTWGPTQARFGMGSGFPAQAALLLPASEPPCSPTGSQRGQL